MALRGNIIERDGSRRSHVVPIGIRFAERGAAGSKPSSIFRRPSRRESGRRLTARQAESNGGARPDEATLVRAAQARLPAAADRRLRKLIARSERGRLTAKELADYQSLAQEAQRIDAVRAEVRWRNWPTVGASRCRRCGRPSSAKAKRMKREAIPRAVRREVARLRRRPLRILPASGRLSLRPFVCEHVLPRAAGAGNTPAELAWACPACNGHKYAETHGRGPQTGRFVPLYNPRRQGGRAISLGARISCSSRAAPR